MRECVSELWFHRLSFYPTSYKRERKTNLANPADAADKMITDADTSCKTVCHGVFSK